MAAGLACAQMGGTHCAEGDLGMVAAAKEGARAHPSPAGALVGCDARRAPCVGSKTHGEPPLDVAVNERAQTPSNRVWALSRCAWARFRLG